MSKPALGLTLLPLSGVKIKFAIERAIKAQKEIKGVALLFL
jgi:hypothetical protein